MDRTEISLVDTQEIEPIKEEINTKPQVNVAWAADEEFSPLPKVRWFSASKKLTLQQMECSSFEPERLIQITFLELLEEVDKAVNKEGFNGVYNQAFRYEMREPPGIVFEAYILAVERMTER